MIFFFLVACSKCFACSKCVGTEGHISHGLGHLVDRDNAVVEDKGVVHLPYSLEAISDQLSLCKMALEPGFMVMWGRVHWIRAQRSRSLQIDLVVRSVR